MAGRFARAIAVLSILAGLASAPVRGAEAEPAAVPRFGVHEVLLHASREPANPYTTLAATATVTAPGGAARSVPLFWDGGGDWRFRVSPNATGRWTWAVAANDPGLDGRAGAFDCSASDLRGSIRPMAGAPHHFAYENGDRMWFLGDTAWGLFIDDAGRRHDRAAALRYLRRRADNGFNAVHAMLLFENGNGNAGGPPWSDLAAERINPAYWREVDERLRATAGMGFVTGLALAWGDKGERGVWAWNKFPGAEARRRYARYVAARYGAFPVYFIVAGEWHAEIAARRKPRDEVFRDFVGLGDALRAADPHRRMTGIHPMDGAGSVREFNAAAWMDFGDYQQNYRHLHARVLESRRFGKPVVNAEYGYFLRDRDGDGRPDKDNSGSADAMRHAAWDIAMAGGYSLTGFGTTYMAGHRSPGAFDPDAERNREWEVQCGAMKQIFEQTEWWTLEPSDGLVSPSSANEPETKENGLRRPPLAARWCLANPTAFYMAYTRGSAEGAVLDLSGAPGKMRIERIDPRTGERHPAGTAPGGRPLRLVPPDGRDWVFTISRVP